MSQSPELRLEILYSHFLIRAHESFANSAKRISAVANEEVAQKDTLLKNFNRHSRWFLMSETGR